MTAAVNTHTITIDQCIDVIDRVGQPPDDRAATCPTCGSAPGWPCVYGQFGAMEEITHVARKRAVGLLAKEWMARCVAAWNAGHAEESSR